MSPHRTPGDLGPDSVLTTVTSGPAWEPVTIDSLKQSVTEMNAINDKLDRLVDGLTTGLAVELDRMCREAVAAHPGVPLQVVNMDHKAYWIATQENHGEMVSDVLAVDYTDPRGFRMRPKL